jgi:co-chaperonin GroES (HSP10)
LTAAVEREARKRPEAVRLMTHNRGEMNVETAATVLAPGALEDAKKRAEELHAVKLSDQKKKRLVPLNNWVLIRKHLRDAVLTDGGLVTGTTEKERSDVGTVVAIAPNVVDSVGKPLDVKVGDVVVYTHFSLTIEDVHVLTGDDSLQSVRGEEIYFKVLEEE